MRYLSGIAGGGGSGGTFSSHTATNNIKHTQYGVWCMHWNKWHQLPQARTGNCYTSYQQSQCLLTLFMCSTDHKHDKRSYKVIFHWKVQCHHFYTWNGLKYSPGDDWSSGHWRSAYTLRKKIWNHLGFLHTLRFLCFVHWIEVENLPHIQFSSFLPRFEVAFAHTIEALSDNVD